MFKKFLPDLSLINDDRFDNATVYLNESYLNIVHKNVIKISYNQLYAIILVKLANLGYSPESEYTYISNVRSILDKYKDKTINWDSNERALVNSYYAYLSRNDIKFKGVRLTKILSEYLKNFYEDLIVKLGNKIIYIDTDAIYLNHIDIITEDLLNTIEVDYDISTIEYFYIISKKRYATMNNGNFELKGIQRLNTKETNIKVENIKHLFKQKKREDFLNSIGI